MSTIGLWEIGEDGPHRLRRSQVELERYLEDWIEADPGLLQHGLTIVGRQLHVEAGYLDLLALDVQGRWTVIEIKRGVADRETLAQALDYAACIAALPYNTLAAHVDAYLRRAGNGRLEDLLRERQLDEGEGDEREVQLMLVGVGVAPGLERMVDFLSGRYDIPISLTSFEVYHTADGRQVLVREMADDEGIAPVRERQPSISVKDVVAKAAAHGLEDVFRAFLEAGLRHDLYPRPYKSSIMFAPPQHRNRCLFTVWAEPDSDGRARVWVEPAAFAEFFPLDEAETVAALGESGYRHMTAADVEAFVRQLDDLFDAMEERSGSYSIDEIRQQHPRAYEKWTAGEEEQLRANFAAGASVEDLARSHQRQPGAIRRRLERLGLL